MSSSHATSRTDHSMSRILFATALLWLVWALLFGPWPWLPLGFAGVGPDSLGAERFVLLAVGLGWSAVLGILAAYPVHAWGALLFAETVAVVAVSTWLLRVAHHGIGPWYELVTPVFALIFGTAYAWILRRLWLRFRAAEGPLQNVDDHVLMGYLEMAETARGETLAELSNQGPVLLVFLRHFGCTFCRETLGDLARRRRDIEKRGTRIVLVHMSSEEEARHHLQRYRLESIDRVQDTECELYRVFGLDRATLLQVFGPRAWWRGLFAGVFAGHGIGWLAGDGFRMPGVFLLREGRIVRSFRHAHASDRPDYMELSQCRVERSPDSERTPA